MWWSTTVPGVVEMRDGMGLFSWWEPCLSNARTLVFPSLRVLTPTALPIYPPGPSPAAATTTSKSFHGGGSCIHDPWYHDPVCRPACSAAIAMGRRRQLRASCPYYSTQPDLVELVCDDRCVSISMKPPHGRLIALPPKVKIFPQPSCVYVLTRAI